MAEKLKKLKATKKAAKELTDKEKLFYFFITSVDMDKEQKKMFKLKSEQLSLIIDQYDK